MIDAGIRQSGPFTALRVAPDGVRVAIVIGGNELTFGAISRQRREPADHALARCSCPAHRLRLGTTSPALTWYGPDDVITLASRARAVTEYPVSGGDATSIPADPA